MKPFIITLVALNTLLVGVSSCSDYSNSTHAEVKQNQHLDDGQIINIMTTVDKGEIAASELALKKNLSPEANAYANYLIKQHQANLTELNIVAKQFGFDPKESSISNMLANNAKQDLKTLDALQGKAFEKAYIDAMVKGHQDGLQLIDTKILPETTNPQLKLFVQQFRKLVASHLEKAQQVQKTL